MVLARSIHRCEFRGYFTQHAIMGKNKIIQSIKKFREFINSDYANNNLEIEIVKSESGNRYFVKNATYSKIEKVYNEWNAQRKDYKTITDVIKMGLGYPSIWRDILKEQKYVDRLRATISDRKTRHKYKIFASKKEIIDVFTDYCKERVISNA
jgi:hypothetical protein